MFILKQLCYNAFRGNNLFLKFHRIYDKRNPEWQNIEIGKKNFFDYFAKNV